MSEAKDCFDTMIEELLIWLVIEFSRRMHEVCLAKVGQSMWDMSKSKCNLFDIYEWRAGRMVFARVQFTDCEGGNVENFAILYQHFRNKVTTGYEWQASRLAKYPDADIKVVERSFGAQH